MKQFTLFFRNGDREVIEGENFIDAWHKSRHCNRIDWNYTNALRFWEEGITNYQWDIVHNEWIADRQIEFVPYAHTQHD